MALFLLSQNPATPRMRPTEITSTASTRKISSDNVVTQRKTLPEIKAGVSITYCEVFGSSRRRSIAQVMNYQSGHSGRNYWNLFQILITMPKTTTFQKKLHSLCWRCYCDACWELCFLFNSFEEHQNKVICTPITWFITLSTTKLEFCINSFFMNFGFSAKDGTWQVEAFNWDQNRRKMPIKLCSPFKTNKKKIVKKLVNSELKIGGWHMMNQLDVRLLWNFII